MFKPHEKLVCFRCGRLPQQFAVLGCSHPICMDCYGQIDKSQQFKTGMGCDCDKYSSMRSSAQVVGSSLTLKEYMPTMHSPEINNEEDYIVGGSTTLASGGSSIRKDSKDSPVMRRKNAPKREKPVSNFELHEAKRRLKTEQRQEDDEGNAGWIHQRNATIQIATAEKGEQTMNSYEEKDDQFSRQLEFVEIQYNKTIDEIKQAVDAKIKFFRASFDSFRENLVQWYIKFGGFNDRTNNINLARLVRDRYSTIDGQLQSFRNDIFEFELKVDKFFSQTSYKPKVRQEKDDDDQHTPDTTNNIYVINRPWMVDVCSRPRCLSPQFNHAGSQYKSAACKLRKQTLKNMDFIDGLLSRNRLKRWCSGSKIIL